MLRRRGGRWRNQLRNHLIARSVQKSLLPNTDRQEAIFSQSLHNIELPHLNFDSPVISHWKVYLPATGGRS